MNSQKIGNVFIEWKLNEKVTSITCDNGSNMIAACNVCLMFYPLLYFIIVLKIIKFDTILLVFYRHKKN